MVPLIWFYLLFMLSASPRILSSAASVNQSEVLICQCDREGFTLPSNFSLQLNHSSKCFFMNFTLNHEVQNNNTEPGNDTNDRNVECVCENNISKIIMFFNTSKEAQSKASSFTQILEKVLADPKPFLIVFGTGVLSGMLLVSIIVCLVVQCHRLCHKNKKKSRNLYESVEMVNTAVFSQVQEDKSQDPEAAEGEAESDARLADESNGPTEETVHSDIKDTDTGPKETVYSNIVFTATKERNPADVEKARDTTETEYAEIKKGETKARQDNDEKEGEILEGSDEKEAIQAEDEEVKQGLLVLEEVPLCSNVDEILDEN